MPCFYPLLCRMQMTFPTFLMGCENKTDKGCKISVQNKEQLNLRKRFSLPSNERIEQALKLKQFIIFSTRVGASNLESVRCARVMSKVW